VVFICDDEEFLLDFGLDTLRDLPDFEVLEDAGPLSKEKLLAGDIPVALGPAHQGGERLVVPRSL
jgi:hypothetical protein